MKTALIAITKRGAELAKKLRAKLESDIYISEKFKHDYPASYFSAPIKILTSELWQKYEALVYFVSLGAVVRTIAPYLKDKHADPAVVVVDDKASFAISVLSGHVGGANELTEEVAKILEATPVITTASDVGKTIPVDILGRELRWVIEGQQNITKVSAAVVNEEPIALVQETGEKNWWKRETPLPKNIQAVLMEEARQGKFSAILAITDRILDDDYRELMNKIVIYRPKSFVLGIGCDRGVTLRQIEDFVFGAMARFKLSFKSVRNVATLEIKRGEPGLQEFCAKYGFQLVWYTSDELKVIAMPNPSGTVEKYTGTPGVCEPAALKSSCGTLIVPKQKAPMLTLAIARVKFE